MRVRDITEGSSSLCKYLTTEMLMLSHFDSIPVPASTTCVGVVLAAACSGAMHRTLLCESFGLDWLSCFGISCTAAIFKLFSGFWACWAFAGACYC